MTPSDLKNHYFVMRHGQSVANIEDMIVSSPEIGIPGYGLTDRGRQQAVESVKACTALDSGTVIFASDFFRTRQTAEIAANLLGTQENIIFAAFLRERFFGAWDLTVGSNYPEVWEADARDSSASEKEVEPCDAVLKRMLDCLALAENVFENRRILLVSHGDPLQILLTFFKGLPAGLHRDIPHLDVAEIRDTRN